MVFPDHCLYAQYEGNVSDFWKEPEGKRGRFSSYDQTGFNRDYIIIRPAQKHTLCEINSSSGMIQRIWFTINAGDSSYLRKVFFRMTFDNEITVNNIPLGMFTGTGPWRVNDITTPLLNVMRARQGNKDQSGPGAGSFNINLPMPYTKNMKIEIVNNTSRDLNLFYYVDYVDITFDEPPLLFHADYNIKSPTDISGRDNSPDNTRNYSFLKAGNYKGRYIGTILCVESHPDRKGKWYEGDDMFVIDNEPWPPGLHGTGTEDYFGMAWGFHRPYQAFDHGISHFEKNITDHDRFYDGRYVAYRFHINDPIIFHKSINGSIESGHANDCIQHYESVAFWYGKTKD